LEEIMQAYTRVRRLFLAVGALSVLGAVQAQTNTTWSLGASGNWNVASNWSGGVIPNNGSPTGSTYSVYVDGAQAYACTVNINAAQSYTVSQLHISSGDQLNINASGTLILVGGGLIDNAGTIALGSVGSLLCNTSTVTLSGGGTITLNNSRLYGSGILHNVDNRIIGAGSFCGNNGGLINAGTITITGNSIIDPSSTEHCFNTGLVDVTAGTLTLTGLNSGSFNNTGGNFVVQNGATLAFQNSCIFGGGTISTLGTGSAVLLASQTGTFDSVTNLGQLTSLNGSNTYLAGSIVNNGSININSTGSGTDVIVPASLNLTGSGALNLNASQVTLGGAGTLTNGSSHTIRGVGALGDNAASFINEGRILADVAGTLTVDPADGTTSFINNGTLQASNGGTLALSGLYGGDFVNTGRIEALNGATIALHTGVKVSGGTLSTGGTGSIVVTNGTGATLADLTNVGHIVALNGTNTYLEGTIVNNGSITITATSSTDLEIAGAVTLSGTGTLNLASSLVSAQGGGTVTNGSAHTICGVGGLGSNALSFINDGRVLADVTGGTLTIDPKIGTTSFVNNGTLQASHGGTLALTGLYDGDFVNALGRIEALDTSMVALHTGARITGGTLSTSGTGSIATTNGSGATLDSVTNQGHIVVMNNTTLYLAGTIVNNGSIDLTSTGSGTELKIPGVATLAGSGTLNLLAAQVSVLGGGTLTNASTHTIRGVGSLGTNGISIINDGKILQDVGSGTLIVDPADTTTGFVNNGLVRVMSGGTITLTGVYGGAFGGIGSYDVQTGAQLRLTTAANVSTGMVINDGTLSLIGDLLDTGGISGAGITTLSDGALSAGFVRQAALSVASSRVATIKPGGTIASTSKLNTLTLAGIAKLDLNDNAMVIDYTGASPFSTIRSTLITGYAGGNWNGAGIVSTAGITNKSQAIGYAEASATGFTTSFRGQSFAGGDAVLLMFTLRGDTNLDRKVDSTDFNAMAPNYGIKDGSALWTQGDCDYNGKVNTIDFNYLAGNFGSVLPGGAGLPGPSLGTVVPEPALLSLISASLFVRRRIRR
jgi:hypothetical protein